MIVNEIKGDLCATLKYVQAHPKVCRQFLMAQGCNCQITQGSGLAKQLRAFPEVYQADIDYGRKGDKSKLGEYSVANLGNAKVFNCYTQLYYGNYKVQVDYDAIEKVFTSLIDEVGKEVLYIPLIGAGLAGGDWNKLRDIINKASGNMKVVVVHFTQDVIIKDY